MSFDETTSDLPLEGSASRQASSEDPVIGQTIAGRYRVLGPIGEGGFGLVYEAEQFEPVRRRVALKVLKPGMDSRPCSLGSKAERQALAMMDHSGIAKVLDAGTTAQGLPFFVMELYAGRTSLTTAIANG